MPEITTEQTSQTKRPLPTKHQTNDTSHLQLSQLEITIYVSEYSIDFDNRPTHPVEGISPNQGNEPKLYATARSDICALDLKHRGN